MDMFVTGNTSTSVITAISHSKPFILDLYVCINDKINGKIIGEVVETSAMPNSSETDPSLSDGLCYIGKIKILKELQLPVTPLSEITFPEYEDVESLLVGKYNPNGFALGQVLGTDSIAKKADVSKMGKTCVLDPKTGALDDIGMPLFFDHYKLREYPHIGLFGGSGSGKTVALRVICEELMKARIPTVVLDPHYEMSFADKTSGLPAKMIHNFKTDYETFQVGINVGIRFPDLNSDELSTLIEYVSPVTPAMKSALESIFTKGETFSALMDKVTKLRIAAENAACPPNLRKGLDDDVMDLYECYKNVIPGVGTLQGIIWRLESLKNTGVFQQNTSGVESCILKRKLAVIRGNPTQIRMVSSYLLRKLYEKRRVYCDWNERKKSGTHIKEPDKFPPFFIAMDEAHLFAPESSYDTPIKMMLREISQEARKYGVFEILATQRPGLLDSTIFSQLNTKIILRTTIENDIRKIRAETGLSQEQCIRLPGLTSGNAYVFSPIIKKTLYVRFRMPCTTSPHDTHPFDELDDFADDSKLEEVILSKLPLEKSDIPPLLSTIAVESGKLPSEISESYIIEKLEKLSNDGKVLEDKTPFGVKYFKK